jgi:hypothetical protein
VIRPLPLRLSSLQLFLKTTANSKDFVESRSEIDLWSGHFNHALPPAIPAWAEVAKIHPVEKVAITTTFNPDALTPCLFKRLRIAADHRLRRFPPDDGFE